MDVCKERLIELSCAGGHSAEGVVLGLLWLTNGSATSVGRYLRTQLRNLPAIPLGFGGA